MKSKLGIFGVALLAVCLVGCSVQKSLSIALGVVNTAIGLAQSDIPALEAAGTFSTSDGTALTKWLNGASALDTQAQVCINTVGTSGTKAALAPCVNAFGEGLLSPTEQADLDIISPAAQAKVTLYVTAVVLAVDVAADLVDGTKITAPVVGTAPPANQVDLDVFKARMHLARY
jgi:hypothetical protein